MSISPEEALRELDRLFKSPKVVGRALSTKHKPFRNPTADEMAAALAQLEAVRRAELEREWRDAELVLFSCRVQCRCGAEHQSFDPQLWLHQTNRHTSATRYQSTQAPEAFPALPRRIMERFTRCNTCPQCFARPSAATVLPSADSPESVQ